MVSFDVFDTAIVRSWWRPADVFLACGYGLVADGLWQQSPEAWQLLRQDAELSVRRSSGHDEITLEEIYREVAPRAGWNQAQMDRALSAELAEERACLSAVSQARAAIARGAHIFITDTYFPASFVAERLGDLFPGTGQGTARLYCSSEFRKTKSRGTLFPAVLEDLALPPGDLHHAGDNRHSDVRMARAAGISATWWQATAASGPEQRLRGADATSSLLLSALAGAARAVRLGGPAQGPHLERVWEIGANFAGPFVFALCTWILWEAKKQGVTRLFFFSRDGQILVQVAQKVARAFGFDIQLRYLHASRQALYFPAITRLRGDAFAERWLRTNIRGKTPRQLLARLHLTPEEIGALDPALAGMWHDPDAAAPQGEAIVAALLASPATCKLVEARAAKARRILVDYLLQEGMLDCDGRVGVVDIGWHGRLQASLQRILDAEFAPDRYPLHGFYAGLRDRPAGAPASRYRAFAAASAFTDCVIESFTMADHGSVAAIERAADGSCVSRLQEEHNDEALSWGLTTLQSAINCYAATVTRSLAPRIAVDEGVVAALRESVVPVVSGFCKKPPARLAEALGALSYSDDQTHCTRFPLAPEISLACALSALTRRRYHGPGKLWIAGSLARSFPSLWARTVLLGSYAARERAKSVLRRLIGRPA